MAKARGFKRGHAAYESRFALVKVARTSTHYRRRHCKPQPRETDRPQRRRTPWPALGVLDTRGRRVPEADVGYYAQIVAGATLATFKIQYFASEGAELAQAAYPAAILNGSLVLRIPLTD